jgi:hypothetical protein
MPENGQSEKEKRLMVKAVRSLIQIGIKHLKRSVSTPTTSVFTDPNVAENLSTVHYIYAVVPADKAATTLVLICSKHCIDCLYIKLSLDSSQGNRTYTATTLSKEEVIDNHMSILSRFGLSMKDEDYDIHVLYRILELHKCICKQRNIAGAPTYSTKPSI